MKTSIIMHWCNTTPHGERKRASMVWEGELPFAPSKGMIINVDEEDPGVALTEVSWNIPENQFTCDGDCILDWPADLFETLIANLRVAGYEVSEHNDF